MTDIEQRKKAALDDFNSRRNGNLLSFAEYGVWVTNHLDLIRTLLQPAPSGWQTIDSAPKDGTEFFGFEKDMPFSIIHWSKDGTERWRYRNGTFYPTHWMPLPSPPKETK